MHEQVAVIVNDMAEVGIDAELLRGSELRQTPTAVVELSNGCICCTLRNDLLQVLPLHAFRSASSAALHAVRLEQLSSWLHRRWQPWQQSSALTTWSSSPQVHSHVWLCAVPNQANTSRARIDHLLAQVSASPCLWRHPSTCRQHPATASPLSRP